MSFSWPRTSPRFCSTRGTSCFSATRKWRSITPRGVEFTDYSGRAVSKASQRVSWDPVMAEKAGFKHFMLKEIFEQPWAVRETVLGRASVESRRVVPARDRDPRRAAALARARRHPGVRHVLALGTRRQVPDRGSRAPACRGRLRVRVPISRSHRRAEHARRRDHAKWRDRRHAGRAARSEEEGRLHDRHLQRRRQHGHAGERRHGLHTRGPGDRRRLHEGVHVAARRRCICSRSTWARSAVR